ncbi:MAG: hypothetical protein ACRCTD_15725 [Beijerinckiaceae bacterium]
MNNFLSIAALALFLSHIGASGQNFTEEQKNELIFNEATPLMELS